MSSKILVVDDEKNILELIRFNLELNQFDVITATDGEVAISMIKAESDIDLIILDLMLPTIDGIEVCKILKRDEKTKDIPVIMLTAKGTETDKIFGLEIGADDYVTKPFSVKELTARVKAQLRRSDTLKQDEDIIVVNSMTINKNQHSVSINNKEIVLTLKEYEVLKLLAENKGKVYTRDQLLNQVWGYDYFGETRTVDVHIRHIRKKIEEYDSSNEYIETIRGVGYKIK
ncbi:MAG: Phosphate regulon transcriptional regulatory protein PhoB (SphR) [Clostridiales bacterium 38_11]|nr:MAG: Phosphate regulon transcriptional regulatory protein PhoB (SphR) [Clostridiales bacterium 38_11]HBH12168.1 DNA-binding response regulator [Clostridiales bacterium]